MKDYYVILTGSKNNAGDFLIKHRAKELFKALRPDRDIIDIDAWELIDDASLNLINGSNALILMGGPALRPKMYPEIYPLRPDLEDIMVPISTMGIGWKSAAGEWGDTYKYSFSKESLRLLQRCEASGLAMSVRDYHSVNVLNSHGFHNVKMTGCPAYYDLNYIGTQSVQVSSLSKIAFSLGVSFFDDRLVEREMKSQILQLRGNFPEAEIDVVFHHGLSSSIPVAFYDDMKLHAREHDRFAAWLESEHINMIDISGSAEKLIEYYSNVDIHIGYRVHAHIFMTSISKPTILLAEDGRGKAAKMVVGGMILDAYQNRSQPVLFNRALSLFRKRATRIVNKNISQDINSLIEYEQNNGWQRTLGTRAMIDNNFRVMEEFIRSLP